MGTMSRLVGRRDDWSGRHGLRARLLAEPDTTGGERTAPPAGGP